MRRAVQNFMRQVPRVSAVHARNVFVATATAGAAYWAMSNTRIFETQFSLLKLGQVAECATEKYQVPDQAYCQAVRDDLMKFCGQRRNMAPLFVRLSWHDCGTFDQATNTGGPRAVMRFDGGEAGHGANAGLAIARNMLAPIKEKYPEMSNADFWALTAVCAIKVMGGPDVRWRAGRPDAVSAEDSVPDGRLPDATQGCPHLRSVFHRMGFTDQEIIALNGAHAVGMCHGDRSGFIGPWTTTALEFDNAFFVNLVKMKWHKTKQANGLEVWVTEDQPGIIMLPTDMAIMTDEKMVPWVELYARDKERWFQDFASAFAKLQELGVENFHKGKVYEQYV